MASLHTLVGLIAARIAALCAGQTWETESGVAVSLPVHAYQLPQPSGQADEDADLPFVLLRPIGGGDSGVSGRDTIRIVGAVVGETDGATELDRLLGYILRIPTGQDFTPYSFEEMTYHLGEWSGDPRVEGRQPHPEYYFTADLLFIRESAFIEE